jgi:hypothetical protein
MYLPNPDLNPTGFEPAEYIDDPIAVRDVPVGPFEPASRAVDQPDAGPHAVVEDQGPDEADSK